MTDHNLDPRNGRVQAALERGGGVVRDEDAWMVSTGLCFCGCGKITPVAPRTRTNIGWVEGQHVRFIKGHHAKGKNSWSWKGDAAGYISLHHHLRRYFPKTGICEKCGKRAETDYALIHGREYSRNREDYHEYCRACHRHYDIASQVRGEKSPAAKLTEADVLDIRARWPGETQQALAQEYGVHKATIQAVVSGKNWRHLLEAS